MKNSDLQQISKLLDDRLEKKLDEKLDEKLKPIKKTLDNHSKMLRKLKRDQGAILDSLDGEQMKQKKHIRRIEEHLSLPPLVS